jgi:hypothetical protein
VDRVHRRRLTGLRTSLNAGRWLPDRRLGLNQANQYLGLESQLFITDPMAEMAGSDRGWHGLTLSAARRGRARRLAGVRVFSSYGGWFSMRFSPLGSQRRGERVYAILDRWRAATETSNGEAARPVLGDGEGSLQ